MAEKFSLKDHLFNKTKVERIAEEIHDVYPPFRKAVFVRDVVNNFPKLELKARISWIAECLRKHLPEEYTGALVLLLKALPPASDPELTDNDFGDFMYAPYAEYVARYGCTKKHLAISLRALREITQRFSAEYAIRNFINAFPDETMKELLAWTGDPNYHVRRLCSEGSRPKLPWAQKINTPIAAPITILDRLFEDKTRYVTRSVANHINDLSKADPELAIRTLIRWQKSGRQHPDEMNYIIKHALRTLVKQGHEQALQLLGFSPSLEVSVSKFSVPSKVKMNTALEFSFTVTCPAHAEIVIDYTLFFQNKAGKLNSKKVFKLTKYTAAAGKAVVVSKRHMLRERMTTRTLYPGKHEIEIQVNGKAQAKRSFLLE
jgi:3-methyladenine DNA glycosylase AlkC